MNSIQNRALLEVEVSAESTGRFSPLARSHDRKRFQLCTPMCGYAHIFLLCNQCDRSNQIRQLCPVASASRYGTRMQCTIRHYHHCLLPSAKGAWNAYETVGKRGNTIQTSLCYNQSHCNTDKTELYILTTT